MSEPDCTDVCETVMSALCQLGFKIDGESGDHTDILDALEKCRLIKDDETEPITLNSKGIKQFIQENFAQETDIEPTDEQIESFKHYLEADIRDWISENWRSFIANRGD